VDGVSDQFLADAAFTADQDGGFAASDLFDGMVHRVHRPRVPDNIVGAEVFFNLLLEHFVFPEVVLDLLVCLLAEHDGLCDKLCDEGEEPEVCFDRGAVGAAASHAESAHDLPAVGHGHADAGQGGGGEANRGGIMKFASQQKALRRGNVWNDPRLAAGGHLQGHVFGDGIHFRVCFIRRGAASGFDQAFICGPVEDSEGSPEQGQRLSHAAQRVAQDTGQVIAVLKRACDIEEDAQFLDDPADRVWQHLEVSVGWRLVEKSTAVGTNAGFALR